MTSDDPPAPPRDAGDPPSEAERRLRQTFASLHEAVFVVDARTRSIVDCNPAAERMFGYAREELIGSETRMLHVDEEHRDGFARHFDPVLLREGAVEMDWRMRRRDGTVFETHHTVTLLDPKGGKPSGVVSVIRDVSTQRRLERELQHAQKLEVAGRLAAGIAHDFNNLLTVIRGRMDMLVEGLPAGSELREEADEVLRAVARGAELTRQLLSFSRKEELRETRFALAPMVLGMLPALRRVIPAGIELRAEGEESGLPVLADESRIQQVLLNLVVNAAQAITGELGAAGSIGSITLRLDRWDAPAPGGLILGRPLHPGAYARLVVEDSGPGIAPDVLERLFEPFFTTKPEGEGTGLGLPIVYGIMAQSRGHVFVEAGEGRGASFTCLLPLQAEG